MTEKDFLAKYGATVDMTPFIHQMESERAARTGTHPRDPRWREWVGFDNISTKEDLALDRPISL